MSIAVIPGSFDPITLGHVDVIRRARGLFDTVIVAVARNASKSPLFSPAQRVELAAAAVQDIDGVSVVEVPGLLVDYVTAVGATAIVKGIRIGADLEAETPMALLNRHLAGIETLFLPADPRHAHIASSLVKDVARHGGPVADMVPAPVAAALVAAFDHPGAQA